LVYSQLYDNESQNKNSFFNLKKDLTFNEPLQYHELVCNGNSCNCPVIEIVNEIKYLGLILDTKLSWKNHVNYVKDKLIKYIRIFYMLRFVCSTELMRILYFALINSKLDYGLSIWGGTYITTLKPLFVIQKSFMRHIAKCPRLTHTEPLFLTFKVLPISNLYLFKVLKIFFNRSNTERRIIRTTTVVLRDNLNFVVPKPNLTIFKHFYTYIAPKAYNNLPRELKQVDSSNTFLN
jgi:hypothetical protein